MSALSLQKIFVYKKNISWHFSEKGASHQLPDPWEMEVLAGLAVSVGSEQLVYAVELQTKVPTKVPNHEEGPFYGRIPYVHCFPISHLLIMGQRLFSIVSYLWKRSWLWNLREPSHHLRLTVCWYLDWRCLQSPSPVWVITTKTIPAYHHTTATAAS